MSPLGAQTENETLYYDYNYIRLEKRSRSLAPISHNR